MEVTAVRYGKVLDKVLYAVGSWLRWGLLLFFLVFMLACSNGGGIGLPIPDPGTGPGTGTDPTPGQNVQTIYFTVEDAQGNTLDYATVYIGDDLYNLTVYTVTTLLGQGSIDLPYDPNTGTQYSIPQVEYQGVIYDYMNNDFDVYVDGYLATDYLFTVDSGQPYQIRIVLRVN